MKPFEAYRITSPYGPRPDPFTGKPTFHTGIDLVKADKAPILAFMSGEVVHAKEGVTGSGFGGFGNVVALKDLNGAIQFYAHLSSISVKLNQNVVAGQQIGLQGNTGHSAGSHLHFEVRLKNSSGFGFGSNTEPTAYIQKYRKEEAEMSKDDANKIIDQLKILWGAEVNQNKKNEIHRLANVLRIASDQPIQ
ncbi:M23 family metallopeptidase [Paenibacillus psychroresistens]|uniref:M23 family metallopeptidase n=1 Tax=Paenibacillus psychroresistens TaxID=1778678 RepID=A0A6B8RE18_9BACL|nr:M23 family metallopeptidase [Paenibacillus psychroresistens]QGQ93964.1 M23 family metallopeptidase [Paenibacillus psychroresistens]